MLEALGEEKRPVAETAEHDASVDEVEVVGGKGPGLFDIVDLVFDIWGRPTGLDRGEVDAIDLGLFRLLRTLKVFEPRSGNCTSVSGYESAGRESQQDVRYIRKRIPTNIFHPNSGPGSHVKHSFHVLLQRGEK